MRKSANLRPNTMNTNFSMMTLRRQYTAPHKYYDALREHDSIYFDASSQCWLVTSYEPAIAILRDARFSSALGESSSTVMSSISQQMLFKDGEEHARMQSVMLKPLAELSKKMPEEIRGFAQRVIEMKCQSQEMDMVSDYASLVSLLSIARVIGIPTEDHTLLLKLERWSDTFGDVTSGYFQGDTQDVTRLEDYFHTLIQEKRREPGDDLLSSFLAAEDIFPTNEILIANCMMVFAAGRLTTKKLLGNCIPFLLPHWEELQKEYKANPKALTKMLGEELLRIITPTRYLMRLATEDVDITPEHPGKHVIHKGQHVLLFLEAVNHDPELFVQAEKFDPLRRPNKHIAFGFGSHQCPGATMARLEIQIALEVLLSLSAICPKPGTAPTWNPNPNLGGYTSCPVLFHV